MHARMNTHTRIHTHTHTRMHTHARTHMRTHAHARTRACTHAHTHTHTTNKCITGDGLVEIEKKETTDQSAEEKRWVSSSDLKEESEDKMHKREEGSSRSQVQCTERIFPPGKGNIWVSLLWCSPAEHSGVTGCMALYADKWIPQGERIVRVTVFITLAHGQSHTLNIAFRHLPPNSARFGYTTEGHSLSPRSCPPMRSAPSKKFGYW